RNWDYEPVSLASFTSDESLLKIDAKVNRLGRADFALTVAVDWNYDADENTMVKADAYHCTSGDESDYKLMPFSVPSQPFFEFLNGFYKDAFIKNVGHCSNLIQFEDKFEPPWPRGVYKMDKCVATGEGLPDVCPEGYYKIIFNATGQVNWGFILVARVTAKYI
ncbi:hypothetical protein KR018_009906, partial [Drosophila ironensis]